MKARPPAALPRRSRAHFNNYGGTIGGPIKKNKLFYFYSFDGTRQRWRGGHYSVPTQAMKAGNFSSYSQTIYTRRPAAPMVGRTAFAGNIIPLAFQPGRAEGPELLPDGEREPDGCAAELSGFGGADVQPRL